MDARSTFFEVNRTRLFGRVWSESGPPLVLLHHLTGTSHVWDAVAPRFTDRFRVIALDLRGHGQSDNPPSGYAWEGEMADDVVCLIQEVLREPTLLIGFSLGAMVAVPVAVKAGDMVRAVVMEDPAIFSHDDPEMIAFFRSILEEVRMPFAERRDRLVQKRRLDPRSARLRAESLGNLAPEALAEYVDKGGAYPAADWVPRLRCPLMVCGGNPELGSVLGPKDQRRLKRLHPRAHVVHWDDMGHGLHEEEPERFAAEVRSFWRREGLI